MFIEDLIDGLEVEDLDDDDDEISVNTDSIDVIAKNKEKYRSQNP